MHLGWKLSTVTPRKLQDPWSTRYNFCGMGAPGVTIDSDLSILNNWYNRQEHTPSLESVSQNRYREEALMCKRNQ